MTFPSESERRIPGVRASFYDGRGSARHAVTVSLAGGMVVVIGDGIERRESLESVEISDPVGTTPRLVRFRDGASCEVHDTVAFTTLLTHHGIAAGHVTQWEGSLKWIGLSAVLFVLVLVAGYRYLLPPLAGVVAARVPEALVDVICGQVMTALDGAVFGPSEVPSETQRRLGAAFRRLTLPGAETASFQILFRSSQELGANALAIPSGEIVVTDALVALAQADEEIVAVLAHEAGHVARRHGLRQLFQNSVVALVVTWLARRRQHAGGRSAHGALTGEVPPVTSSARLMSTRCRRFEPTCCHLSISPGCSNASRSRRVKRATRVVRSHTSRATRLPLSASSAFAATVDRAPVAEQVD